MFLNNFFKSALILAMTSTLVFASSEIAEVLIKKDSVVFKNVKGISKYSLHISGPQRFSFEKENNTSTVIKTFGKDGRYKYELTEHLNATKKQRSMNDRERNSLSSFTASTVAKKQYGHFIIKLGKPIIETEINER